MSDTEHQLADCRKHLEALCMHLVSDFSDKSPQYNKALAVARDFLKATEAKHPVEVEWEKWNLATAPRYLNTQENAKSGFFAGFKVGMEHAVNIIDYDTPSCSDVRQRIRDAAAKVPTS